MAANLQIEKTNLTDVSLRVSNPFGTSDVKFLEDYQVQGVSNTQEIEEMQYKNLQRAESNYFMAAVNLGHSDAIKQYNLIARMNGYDRVNTLHRQDIA